MSTDIEQVTKALTDFDTVAAGLANLEKQYKGVLFEVDTPRGMEHAKAARQVLRKPRYEVERIRKEAKAPLLAIGKKLDDEAKRITAAIVALEDPIDQQIKQEEQRQEDARKAKLEAEAKRVADIQARIDAIRALPVQASGKSSEQIGALYTQASAMVIDESFQEFADTARTVLAASVAALSGLRTLAAEQEAEQARIRAERAELERLRAEQAERERVDRERREKEEREARAAREAEDKAAREKFAAEQAEITRKQREEQERIDAENKRLAAERAELERQQAETRRQAAEAEARRKAEEEAERQRKEAAAEAARKAKYPGEQAIVDALCEHFRVPDTVVRGWLSQLKVAA